MTYTEERKRKPFDWNKFLNQKRYTKESLIKAVSLAGSWVTCACGSQCSLIERDDEGRPEDIWLRMAGMGFYSHIYDMNLMYQYPRLFESARDRAKKSLAEVEQRSAEILDDLRKKPKAIEKAFLVV